MWRPSGPAGRRVRAWLRSLRALHGATAVRRALAGPAFRNENEVGARAHGGSFARARRSGVARSGGDEGALAASGGPFCERERVSARARAGIRVSSAKARAIAVDRICVHRVGRALRGGSLREAAPRGAKL